MKTLAESLKILFGDKKTLLLALAPFLLGTILYLSLGTWAYSTAFKWISRLLDDYYSLEKMGTLINIILSSVLGIIILFTSSWIFFFIVSIISCPFNDMISSRIEQIMLEKELTPLKKSFLETIHERFRIVMNEGKKIVLFIFVGLLGFILSPFPILIPLYLLIVSLLFSAGYLDYSWSRHHYSPFQCIQFLKNHIIPCFLSGFTFLAITSIPFINIFVPPLAIVYFSVFFSKKLEPFSSKTPSHKGQ